MIVSWTDLYFRRNPGRMRVDYGDTAFQAKFANGLIAQKLIGFSKIKARIDTRHFTPVICFKNLLGSAFPGAPRRRRRSNSIRLACFCWKDYLFLFSRAGS